MTAAAPSRVRRWLRAAGWLYAATVAVGAALCVYPGRLGLVSRFGLAPDLLLPVTEHIEETNVQPDGSKVHLVCHLPTERTVTLRGRPQSPPLRIYSHTETPSHVWFVCPAGGGRGERWAQMAWIALHDDDAAAVGFAWERDGERGPFVLETTGDVAAAAFATLQTLYPGVPVVVFGASLGCAAALQVAAANPDVVRGVVLDSPGDLRHEIGRRTWLAACPPLFVGTAPWIASAVPACLDQRSLAAALPSELPVLLLGYDQDPIADPQWLDVLADALGARATVVRTRADRHCRLVDRLLPGPEPVFAFVRAALARR